MQKRKVNPTRQESKAAVEAQAPITEARPMTESTAIARPSPFKQLAKSSRRLSGDATTFVKPEMLFNENYRDGFESTPFFISKAFHFESKGGFGSRLGLTVVLMNGNHYNVAVPLTPGDQKRNGLIQAFEQDSTPIGPVCFVKLSLNRGNDYYDIQPFGHKATDQIDIPFPDVDDGMPF